MGCVQRTASGELLVISPTGGSTGNRSGRIAQQLFNWTDSNELGIAFDSETGFKLPNGANRSPDASWVRIERWNTLTPEQQEKFATICPDFVVELRSPSDSIKDLLLKMREYIENGASLGWLIDRKNKRVEIYRPNQDVEIMQNPVTLSGEDILPGFVLDLKRIMP